MKCFLTHSLHYRICGPSEDDVCQFTRAMPDVHNFPLAIHTAVDTLKVVVNHLPRLTSIPFVSNCKLAAEGISKCLSDSSIDSCTIENKATIAMSSSTQHLRTNNGTSPKINMSPNVSLSSSSNGHCFNGKLAPSASVNSQEVTHHCSQEFCFDATCLSTTARSPTHNVQLLSPSNSSSVSGSGSRHCEAFETISSHNSKRTDFLKHITAKKLESSGRSKEISSKGKVCPPEASSPVRLHLSLSLLTHIYSLFRFHSAQELPNSLIAQQMMISINSECSYVILSPFLHSNCTHTKPRGCNSLLYNASRVLYSLPAVTLCVFNKSSVS